MPDTPRDLAEKEKILLEVLAEWCDRFRSYHDHKESMAYAGITLFAGAGLASLFSSRWPPDWGEHTKALAIAAVLALWIVFLVFLRFQLRRRRWAALRVAGCERLQARLIQGTPSEQDLAPWAATAVPKTSLLTRFTDWFWPRQATVKAVDLREGVYPRILVQEWLEQEARGTEAIDHERLITVTGWLITFLSVVRVTLS